MKIEIKNILFRPLPITLTFESQRELDAFGALFNYTAVTDALEAMGLNTGELSELIEGAGGHLSGDTLTALVRLLDSNVCKLSNRSLTP